MQHEIDIGRLGDYGLIFVALYDAMADQDNARVQTISESIIHLARQKQLSKKERNDGVILG